MIRPGGMLSIELKEKYDVKNFLIHSSTFRWQKAWGSRIVD